MNIQILSVLHDPAFYMVIEFILTCLIFFKNCIHVRILVYGTECSTKGSVPHIIFSNIPCHMSDCVSYFKTDSLIVLQQYKWPRRER